MLHMLPILLLLAINVPSEFFIYIPSYNLALLQLVCTKKDAAAHAFILRFLESFKDDILSYF